MGDLRVLCFRWLLERVPVGSGGGGKSSAWDLVEALESSGRRADGGSVGESVMVWLEMLRHGEIWPREVPAEAVLEARSFRYRSALAGGGPGDVETGVFRRLGVQGGAGGDEACSGGREGGVIPPEARG